jgi:hypothetical protein
MLLLLFWLRGKSLNMRNHIEVKETKKNNLKKSGWEVFRIPIKLYKDYAPEK